MEEMFEAILGLIIIAAGIAAKTAKNKKKQQPPQPKATAWDELSENIEQRFNEFIEKNNGEPIIPYAPSQPAPAQPAVPPAPPAPAVQPVVVVEKVPELHLEGMPAEPVMPPMPKPKPKPRPEPKPMETIQSVHHKSRSRLIPERINADTLRSAVVMSEVLGKPVALRNAARR